MIPFTITDGEGTVRFGVKEDGEVYHRPDLTVGECVRLSVQVIIALRDRLREKVDIISGMEERASLQPDLDELVEPIRRATRVSRRSIAKVLDAAEKISMRSMNA